MDLNLFSHRRSGRSGKEGFLSAYSTTGGGSDVRVLQEGMMDCCRWECSCGGAGHVRFVFAGFAVECQDEKIDLSQC